MNLIESIRDILLKLLYDNKKNTERKEIFDKYICKKEIKVENYTFKKGNYYNAIHKENSKFIGICHNFNSNTYFQLNRKVKDIKLPFFYNYFEKLTDKRKRKLKKVMKIR